MSSCSLRIALDPSGPVPAGTPLTGTVHVEVNAPVACKALEVELRWFINGNTRRDPERCRSVVVFEGHWPAGVHAVPFSIAVPPAPLTLRSKVVKLDWELTARADIPWAIDPSHTVPVAVVRHPDRPRQRADIGAPQTSEVQSVVGSYFVAIIAIGMGGIATWITGLLSSMGITIAGLFLPVGLLFVGVGARMIWQQVQTQRQRARLSLLTLGLSKPLAWPGDTIEATLSLGVEAPLDLFDVTLTLRREAHLVTRDSQDRTRTRASWDHVQTQTVWQEVLLTPAAPKSKTVTLRLPADASPTTWWPSVGARWCVVMEASLRGGTEPIRHEVDLQVG